MQGTKPIAEIIELYLDVSITDVLPPSPYSLSVSLSLLYSIIGT